MIAITVDQQTLALAGLPKTAICLIGGGKIARYDRFQFFRVDEEQLIDCGLDTIEEFLFVGTQFGSRARRSG